MGMITKKDFGTRRYLFAVAIFFGVSATTCQAAESQTESSSVESEADENIGLQISGVGEEVVQSENILLTDSAAIGIRVDGLGNKITLPRGTVIQSGGKGILISYGRGQSLDVAGNVTASGNAIEFNFDETTLDTGGELRGSYIRYLRSYDAEGNLVSAVNLPLIMSDGEFNYAADELDGAIVNDFNLSGKIAGKRAIYIGKNTFVKNININRGAQISGNIVSDWKHFAAFTSSETVEPIKIQYGDQVFTATRYIPDLVTNLNFNTSLTYDGNISGADNIRVNVNKGTLNFSGTADVVSVEVMSGAKLYGGTFTLNSQTLAIADGYSDEAAGKFINHGTIAAASPDTNLIINGDLVSDGVIQKVSGGAGGSIIVSGNANIDGSTVTTDSLLPNQTATVLVANTITGDIKNPTGKPIALSAMLSATGKIVDNTL
ncbi:MAG: autotransporter outer membrane beta-barrel domain-containing protein, partial [Selenomonadaceae bacterium]|nr:autotransporter outer membrane beta-barrel domain-containing protein [Selenomonadaceae bacterium]